MSTADLKFTKEHEWIRIKGDIAEVGISDYAQKELGDVVYVETQAIGNSFKKGDPCSSIESVKAVSDIYAPLSGEITAVNEELENNPALINQSPYEAGWIFKMKIEDKSEIDDLMDAAAYEKYLQGILSE